MMNYGTKTKNVLLLGIDHEGDSREVWFGTIGEAKGFAGNMTSTSTNGEPWMSWEIWHNNPTTSEWVIFESFKQPATT